MRIAALVAVLLVPSLAPAQSLRLVNTSLVQYTDDNGNTIQNDDRYGVGVDALHLTGIAEGTTAYAQLQGFAFTNYPDVPSPTLVKPSAYRSQARLERLQAIHQTGDVTLTLGDHPRQLGRGIVLSLRKVDELGNDRAMRGAGVRLEGDTFGGEVFAGTTNTENLDAVTFKYRDDPNDTIAGASATAHLGSADVSVHGLYLEPSQAQVASLGKDHTEAGGAFLEAPAADWLSLYVEGAFERYTTAGSVSTGTAAYTAADMDLGFVSVLAEGVLLDRFQIHGSTDPILGTRFVYNQPPTLERFDQEVLDINNVRGGRLRVSKSFYDGGLIAYVNGMFRQFAREPGRTDALHGYGGFELTYGQGRSRWNLSGGWRQETLTTETEPIKTMAHVESQWAQDLGNLYSLHFDVFHESRRYAKNDYVRGSTLLGLENGAIGSATVEVGYDTQNENQRNFFLAGILTWKATDAVFLRTVFGTQRGGIKCIGGVCRNFPPFAGARLEATVQYDAM